jgi:tRNA (cytidine/uridine-2'-O-)-methyltransferase
VFEIVLFQPEIPPNTGNVLRLAANTGCGLHLVKPLGFHLTERRLRRAGLDYDVLARVTQHADWESCRKALGARRWFALTTRAERIYASEAFVPGDVFVFGPETRGLPQALLEQFTPERRLALPMRHGNRSVNLANAVAIVVYEAWRQQGFR